MQKYKKYSKYYGDKDMNFFMSLSWNENSSTLTNKRIYYKLSIKEVEEKIVKFY